MHWSLLGFSILAVDGEITISPGSCLSGRSEMSPLLPNRACTKIRVRAGFPYVLCGKTVFFRSFGSSCCIAWLLRIPTKNTEVVELEMGRYSGIGMDIYNILLAKIDF